ncbi:DUF4296 domain-containing protein [Marinirhabdus gelatinilytica]|uniref:Uncharacterized protein DUF4296 n=1 Tax=Marinirhabdus gelatinilytica TaxID=1703343 RepID=A0A370QKE3_9FLAO|nr:DUF4296 domain-containing protein [Marinirhabdus gelatinilytica]RDK88837.1 uncharacterized protein DUF4296 [Marinirhabdus gelatinilytica]
MKFLCYISMGLLLLGCQDVKKPEKPENLIPEDTMVQLLADIYMGNAARSIDNKTIRKKGVKIDSFLFAKYKVDSLQFAKSNAYYATDLNTYTRIFQKIEQQLETLKEQENERKLELNAERKKARDSANATVQEEVEKEIDTSETEGVLIEPATSQQ